MSKLNSWMRIFKKIYMWHNLKVLNLRNLPIKYTIYKNPFMDLIKLQGVEYLVWWDNQTVWFHKKYG
jgi:hypothetical protein